jgi:hypothetical protein
VFGIFQKTEGRIEEPVFIRTPAMSRLILNVGDQTNLFRGAFILLTKIVAQRYALASSLKELHSEVRLDSVMASQILLWIKSPLISTLYDTGVVVPEPSRCARAIRQLSPEHLAVDWRPALDTRIRLGGLKEM